MELHRLLAFVGAMLLVATFVINADYDNNDNDSDKGNNGIDRALDEFNYAYVTGVAMLAALVASFAIFTVQKMKRGFAS